MKYRPKHILKHKRGTQRVRDGKSLCGKSYYGNSLLTDFRMSGDTCKVCDRIAADCVPEAGCNWSYSWSREEIEPYKAIRETAQIGNITITALHSRHLTRIWFRHPCKDKHTHSIKFLSKLTKTWVDTQFFRSTTLQEYLEQMIDGH